MPATLICAGAIWPNLAAARPSVTDHSRLCHDTAIAPPGKGFFRTFSASGRSPNSRRAGDRRRRLGAGCVCNSKMRGRPLRRVSSDTATRREEMEAVMSTPCQTRYSISLRLL